MTPFLGSVNLLERLRAQGCLLRFTGLLKDLVKGTGEQPSAGAVVSMELGCVVHPVQMCLLTWTLSELIFWDFCRHG